MTTRYDLGTTEAGINWWMERVADGPTIRHRWAIHSHQEVDHILDANKAMATHNDGYMQEGRWGRRVATIPMGLIELWKTIEGWDARNPDHADKLAQKLNDGEWQFLRTAPGRLDVKNGQLR